MNIKKLWLSGFVCLLFVATLHAGDTSVEYKIKAGYLYNFTKFISWPNDKGETFNLCLLGTDPFGELLKPIEQRNVLGRPIKLLKLNTLTGSSHCHILFIGDAHNFPLAKRLTSALTVGEGKGFAEQGGMIGFVNKDSRIRLDINLQAIRQSDLKISAKLLEVADIVAGDKP